MSVSGSTDVRVRVPGSLCLYHGRARERTRKNGGLYATD